MVVSQWGLDAVFGRSLQSEENGLGNMHGAVESEARAHPDVSWQCLRIADNDSDEALSTEQQRAFAKDLTPIFTSFTGVPEASDDDKIHCVITTLESPAADFGVLATYRTTPRRGAKTSQEASVPDRPTGTAMYERTCLRGDDRPNFLGGDHQHQTTCAGRRLGHIPEEDEDDVDQHLNKPVTPKGSGKRKRLIVEDGTTGPTKEPAKKKAATTRDDVNILEPLRAAAVAGLEKLKVYYEKTRAVSSTSSHRLWGPWQAFVVVEDIAS
ncbi:hypothetical protein B0H16DRAFT_1478991 [Mycena metata]|uniref:Uncharacterized protein n=1 Tax=Mycena metata TaxID=1033252 RepID=A0AAD7H676_9AGAR|nr:hypothetical protein B0H16DRAFT_1478991 [Mycena metata]